MTPRVRKATEEMTNIYVITSGDYSDYRIIGVYDDLEIAQKIENSMEGARDNYRLESYELNQLQDKWDSGRKPFEVEMVRSGDSKVRISEDFTNMVELVLVDPGKQVFSNPVDTEKYLIGDVWAKDEQHAVKIVNEKRSLLIASGEWDE